MLHVEDFSLSVRRSKKIILHKAHLQAHAGDIVGIVGPSGCGKTLFMKSLMGFLPPQRFCMNWSRLDYGGKLLSRQRDKFAMTFQDPKSALNPTMRVGLQVAESYRVNKQIPHKASCIAAKELLSAVGLDPKHIFSLYPHELSGGMQQRVMLSVALACEPDVLIADEPTSSVELSLQEKIMDLLCHLQKAFSLTVLLVTHDLDLAGSICTSMYPMRPYNG